MEDLFQSLFERLTEAVTVQMGVDKERLDYLQEAVVSKSMDLLRQKEFDDITMIVAFAGIRVIKECSKNPSLKSLTKDECAALGMTKDTIIKKLIKRLHEDNPSHKCSNCIAEYICVKNGKDENKKA